MGLKAALRRGRRALSERALTVWTAVVLADGTRLQPLGSRRVPGPSQVERSALVWTAAGGLVVALEEHGRSLVSVWVMTPDGAPSDDLLVMVLAAFALVPIGPAQSPHAHARRVVALRTISKRSGED